MNKRSLTLFAAAAVVAGGLAVAHTTMEGMDHSGMKMDMGAMGSMDHTALIPPEFAEDPATLAYAKAMNDMMAGMMVPYTGDPDVDFMAGMIPHHKPPSIWRRLPCNTAKTRKYAPLPKPSSWRRRPRLHR